MKKSKKGIAVACATVVTALAAAFVLFWLFSKKPADIPVEKAEKWDIVKFGTFAGEPIEWLVIDRYEGKIMLLSLRCLEVRPYQMPIRGITWSESSLRHYLNGDFYENAFSESEKLLISDSENFNEGNEFYNIDGGPDTVDRVFILSEQEYRTFFASEENIWLYGRSQPAEYAKVQGISTDSNGFSSWWLRGPGNETYSAKFVEGDGNVFRGGAEADIDYYYGVRPVICLSVGN